jgi:hypothetical protein
MLERKQQQNCQSQCKNVLCAVCASERECCCSRPVRSPSVCGFSSSQQPALALHTLKMAATVLMRNAEGCLSNFTTSYPSDDNMRSVRPCFAPVFYEVFFFNAPCLFIPLNLCSFFFRVTPFGGFLAFI